MFVTTKKSRHQNLGAQIMTLAPGAENPSYGSARNYKVTTAQNVKNTNKIHVQTDSKYGS